MKSWIKLLAGLAIGFVCLQAQAFAQPATDSAHQGVYVWRSQPLLSPASQQRELDNLQRYGIDRLYIGLNAQQAADLNGTKAAIASLLLATEARKMDAFLLLGDASWILPVNRPKLLSLVDKLAPLPFKGLLLDIEIEQLSEPSLNERYALWFQTLNAVTRTSNWPVTTVSHWRWFADEDMPALCVGSAGIQYASMMIYTTNLEVIRDKLTIAQKRCPGTHFSISQSIENILEPEETWSGKGSFTSIQKRISEQFPKSSTVSIDWQDWDHLQASILE